MRLCAVFQDLTSSPVNALNIASEVGTAYIAEPLPSSIIVGTVGGPRTPQPSLLHFAGGMSKS